MKRNDFLKSIIVLAAICLVIAAAMAAINKVTAPKIDEVNRQKQAEALAIVVEKNGGFEEVSVKDKADSITSVHRDLDGDGYAVLLSVKGYDSSKPMSVAVGFDKDGKILKCHVISCTGETSGIGSKVSAESFLAQFDGKSETQSVDTISGATISSEPFIAAVGEALDTVKALVESEAAK